MFFHGSADPVSGIGDLAQVMAELVEAGIPHGAEDLRRRAAHLHGVRLERLYLEDADADSWAGLLTFLDETL
jgi:hypothetical protein